MFNKSRHWILSGFILLTGCASYEASSLSLLSAEAAIASPKNDNVLVSWKAFSKQDCDKYLDRDVLAEGYVPVQFTIRNNTTDPLYLSPNNFSIPLSSAYEVADKVHTSTGGRVAAWGVGGLIFFPLFIPAIVDGFKSADANTALDADYTAKVLKEQSIQPHSVFNGVVFIPKEHAQAPIQMFLVNQKTNEKVVFSEIPISVR